MSGYNLSSIWQQVTKGFQIPRNGEPAWIPSSRFSRAGIPKKRNPQRLPGSWEQNQKLTRLARGVEMWPYLKNGLTDSAKIFYRHISQ